MRYLTCEPSTKLNGQAAQAYIHNLRSQRITPIIERHGLTNIDPNEWYPCQTFLDVLNDIAQESDSTSDFVALGMKIAETAMLPPDVQRLDDLLMMLDVTYQMNHQDGDVGRFVTEKIADNHYKIYFEDIYPDDFTYGILFGLAKRFLPKGTSFTVQYENPMSIRDRGGSETIAHVEWQ